MHYYDVNFCLQYEIQFRSRQHSNQLHATDKHFLKHDILSKKKENNCDGSYLRRKTTLQNTKELYLQLQYSAANTTQRHAKIHTIYER
jgi:hypothetical protein